jgi:hypothetical protein
MTGALAHRWPADGAIADDVVRQHFDYRDQLLRFIKRAGRIDMLTLGPAETSSCHAARYFSAHAGELCPGIPYQLEWRTSFDDVYAAFKTGTGGLLLVPNAYEGITDMYWDPEIRFLYCFYCDTPPYGLAVRSRQALDKPVVTLATCPAVRTLGKALGQQLLAGRSVEIVTVASTTAAARAVADGAADLAMTNVPGGTRHQLEFVTPVGAVMMLWSLFRRSSEQP